MPELAVELYGDRIGLLTGDQRDFDFRFEPQALARYGAGSAVLSVGLLTAVPLKASQRERRQTFFHELLPEGRNLSRLARLAGVAEANTLGILARFGRDVAGALQIWDLADPAEPLIAAHELVDDAAVAHMLTNPAETPLGNAPGRGKTSLAGVQDKIVLARIGDRWHRPLNGWSSTHIVKARDPDRPATTIWDEEYGMRLASALGLAGHRTWIQEFAGVYALVAERYDRSGGDRVHQEDFSQALGLRGDQKYQRYGGLVNLTRVAETVRRFCGEDAVLTLARRVVLAAAVGDLDMHAKNIALLHPPSGAVELAPAYDVVPQAHQPNDGELAMPIGGEYSHARVTAAHLVQEFASWHLRTPDAVVADTLEQLNSVVAELAPLPGAHPQLQDDIATFTARLLSGSEAGTPASTSSTP